MLVISNTQGASRKVRVFVITSARRVKVRDIFEWIENRLSAYILYLISSASNKRSKVYVCLIYY